MLLPSVNLLTFSEQGSEFIENFDSIQDPTDQKVSLMKKVPRIRHLFNEPRFALFDVSCPPKIDFRRSAVKSHALTRNSRVTTASSKC
jgi:hypothetical protein